MRVLLAVPIILIVALACTDDPPTPEECLQIYSMEFEDPNEGLQMHIQCRQIMENYLPTVSPSLQSLREEYPEVVGRYWANGSSRYLRANNDTMEIHLDGGCPEGPIQPTIYTEWIIEAIEETCGVQEEPTAASVPLPDEE